LAPLSHGGIFRIMALVVLSGGFGLGGLSGVAIERIPI
jgi:hypothetical protein